MADITPSELFDFAYFDHLDTQLMELAQLAEDEDWSSSEAEDKPHHILYHYLRYSFKRLVEEEKLVFDSTNEFVCFNTGLVTSLQEDIFALFRKNLKPDGSPWYFIDWIPEGKYNLDKFQKLPELAHYFDDPARLVFDSRKEIRYNLSHIIQDNRDRFPEALMAQGEYKMAITLKGAIDWSIKLVQRNYRIAIPQYYNETIQLLLPLCLFEQSKEELALVVQRTGDHYRASTVLNLSQAYHNARHLVRPNRDWLIP